MAAAKGNRSVGEISNSKVKLLISVLAFVCFALLIAVIVLAVLLNRDPEQLRQELFCSASDESTAAALTSAVGSDLYRDLSNEELTGVRDYLLAQPELNLTQYSKATGLDNYIFIIELMDPDKDEALAFLDNQGKKPARQARVIIYGGARDPPVVQEFLVPVDKPEDYTEYSPGHKNPIPYSNRPFAAKEVDGLQDIVDDFTRMASDIMWESFEMNCSSSPCCTKAPAPVNKPGGDHSFWARLFRLVNNGPTSIALPLELYILSDGSAASSWKIGKVLYNNIVFDSVDKFLTDYKTGKVPKVFQPAKRMEDWYTDMHPRGTVKPSTDKVEPTFYERGGRRYTAEENHVEYLGWSFDFRVRTTSGLQLFDIKFNGSRIIYELSLQEATAFQYNGAGKYASYAGMPATALVVRTIMVPYNYDYVFDYMFYPNGVIEVKGVSMGYIICSFWDEREGRYGNRVQENIAGPVHDHMFNFKVDFDIAGRKNSFELIRSKVKKTSRWMEKGDYHYERYIEREQKTTEKEAAYTYDFQTPSYLNIYNANEKNSFGVRRGYRVQLNGITRQMYPSNWSFTNAFRWSDKQVFVTKYKSSETRSAIYNQMDFHDPVLNFHDFIEDNDDITNEDLVTWVTVGALHVPHSEDIPMTAGIGTAAGFYLRPFNYFDEDPSVSSRDLVVITPGSGGKSKVDRPRRASPQTCIPRHNPIKFTGNL